MTEVLPPSNGAMMENDRASAALGMVVHASEPGRAVVSMLLRDDMMNGFDVTHGGIVFALADTAFAIACNDDHHVTLASGADITFLKPTAAGQTLTATAVLRTKSGRSGLYDVRVANEHSVPVAEFRGRSRTTNFPVPGSVAPLL
ncbi:hydroxyphenylacetyl-CoA thioesterase PaaI [Cryobacterium sp. TMT2-18-3]|uniref:hydroxyphenylacetyl-CoA thioesterase PaaI n=1 Tax=unclassified Cryobacterium TaxID=2649013 RepID=UPI00106ADA41|nr:MULTISPECIES: hydroxyphenylacetyl-CoA thioesterase PaaI [unclassified Cryobacterium]TFC30355.1 hydroxyphenylacetyl-CoA thioesterase PaaI [Cryobacterium sp. TMT2-18-2]TFC33103.1 hydroxyphenylacetyl-CoA thioesterase PaaI [Cryobacterium sp. TMT2-42-4]TFC62446.1 hydroxyphenylacetyl-CoA thioesterase PaaI [Cryobacterium sp. TMT2-15-1]TFC66814.1 hydroxyphenylacetyl-CoA thioesterase PaaI [Cryobacterium sp. TMT2-18-3]